MARLADLEEEWPLPGKLSVRGLEDILAAGDVEKQRDFLRALFARVEIHRDRLVYVSHFEGLPPIHVERPAYYGRNRGRLNLRIISDG